MIAMSALSDQIRLHRCTLILSFEKYEKVANARTKINILEFDSLTIYYEMRHR